MLFCGEICVANEMMTLYFTSEINFRLSDHSWLSFAKSEGVGLYYWDRNKGAASQRTFRRGSDADHAFCLGSQSQVRWPKLSLFDKLYGPRSKEWCHGLLFFANMILSLILTTEDKVSCNKLSEWAQKATGFKHIKLEVVFGCQRQRSAL